MKAASWVGCRLFALLLPLVASAGSSPSADTVSALCPAWNAGDWWTVESQIYDRRERRPGALPGWLPKETWRFSVVGTNSVEGEPCYQLTVKSEGQNPCPYCFSYWLRAGDLLVLRRELHQPAASKTGRPLSAPVVQANYSKDEATPFVPPDFPSLPMTVPHFSGGLTNTYAAGTGKTQAAASLQGGAPKSPRSFAAGLTQGFCANEHLEGEVAVASSLPAPGNAPSVPSKCGVFVLAHAQDKYERQSWRSDLPWHTYGEKWEDGVMVRKSWLSAYGHSAAGAGPQTGGEK